MGIKKGQSNAWMEQRSEDLRMSSVTNTYIRHGYSVSLTQNRYDHDDVLFCICGMPTSSSFLTKCVPEIKPFNCQHENHRLTTCLSSLHCLVIVT